MGRTARSRAEPHRNGARRQDGAGLERAALARHLELFHLFGNDVLLLMAFLIREKMVSGEYLEAARSAYQKHKRKMAADVLPDAWNRVLTGPNKILVEILSDATEKICGYKPEPGMVEEFIRTQAEQWALARDRVAAPATSPASNSLIAPSLPLLSDQSSDIKTKKPEFFADKSITSLVFRAIPIQ